MTDNDIIKALECCRDTVNNSNCCKLCPYYEVKDCAVASANDILDLITRKQSEIERLKTENKHYAELEQGCYVTGVKNIKAVAYKEFAEKLKDIFEHAYQFEYGYLLNKDVINAKIDNLVKEMVGENNE